VGVRLGTGADNGPQGPMMAVAEDESAPIQTGEQTLLCGSPSGFDIAW
jgi:hypothetical protein